MSSRAQSEAKAGAQFTRVKMKGMSTFSSLWKLLIEKPTTIGLIEHGGETPWALGKGLHILDLYLEDITRLCALNLKGSRKVVDTGKVDVLNVICAVIVANLSTCPVKALDLNSFTGGNLAGEWDCKS